MAQSKSSKVISKKHLARLERERRQTRAITIGAVAVLAVVFLSILYGALNETLFNNYRTIVTVNDTKVAVREYQARAMSTREQLIDQYMYYYQMAMMFGMDPSTDTSLSELFTNIQNQLDYPELLANQVLTTIEDDLMIKQFAQENGILVTEEDVQAAIESTYQFFPNGSPTPSPTGTSFAFSTLSALQLDLITATPTTEPTFTRTPGPVNTATPAVTTAPTTPEPSATPYTAEGFAGQYQDALDHYRTLGFNEQMFRTIFFENAIYRERVKALVTANVPHEEEKVWARHILVADQATADMVQTLLMAGGDFATLAVAYSSDSSKDAGGDLGWFGRGAMIAEFEEAAFALQIGEISQPVLSQYGYHIIQVLGHETRSYTVEEYQAAVDDVYQAWVEAQRTLTVITVNPEYLTYLPTKPTLEDAFMDKFATETALAPTNQAQQETYEALVALTPVSTTAP